MGTQSFVQTAKMMFGRTKFWAKQNSPSILTFAGIALSAVSIGLAVYETTKLEKVVTPQKKKIVKLKEEMKNPPEVLEGETPINYKGELRKVYAKTTFEVCKLYAPAFISFVLSATCVFGSHKIMKGRNLALAAAYATLDNGYRLYRSRVAERFGEEVENELYRGVKGLKAKESKENEKDDEKSYSVHNSDREEGDWCIWFDESNPNWEKNGVLNLEWLEMQERFANQKLKSQGYLFLYDVYKQLGIDDNMIGNRKLQGSRVVGWLYDPKDPTRDSYISFGIRDRKTGEYSEEALAMRKFGERNILVDFNVDGDILTGRIGDDGKPMKTFVTRIREIDNEGK